MMRLLRAVSAGVVALVALLTWMASEPSAQRDRHVVESTDVVSSVSPMVTSTIAAERLRTSQTARQSARLVARQLLARARAFEGDGGTTLTSPLATSPAVLLGELAESARVRLRRLAQSHSPYGEPSPFDATAPPITSRRNG